MKIILYIFPMDIHLGVSDDGVVIEFYSWKVLNSSYSRSLGAAFFLFLKKFRGRWKSSRVQFKSCLFNSSFNIILILYLFFCHIFWNYFTKFRNKRLNFKDPVEMLDIMHQVVGSMNALDILTALPYFYKDSSSENV